MAGAGPAEADAWSRVTINGTSVPVSFNDGDSFRDGHFWRDGSYPPCEPDDMQEYDRVIADCHRHGIRPYRPTYRFLRADPDVIMVGEIRDEVTARLAVEATLTGHKVLSTFHTEDSVGEGGRIEEINDRARKMFGLNGDLPNLHRMARLAKPEDSFYDLLTAEGRADTTFVERTF